MFHNPWHLNDPPVEGSFWYYGRLRNESLVSNTR